jgi:hypothetical protein
MSTYWRVAGLTYLPYLNAASGSVRSAAVQSLQAAVAQREIAYVVERNYQAGENSAKVEVESWKETPYSTKAVVE